MLTFSSAACALLFHLITGGWSAAGWSVVGCVARRGVVLSDVRACAAWAPATSSCSPPLGAWLGPRTDRHGRDRYEHRRRRPRRSVVALGHGYLRTALSNLWMMLMHWRVMGVRPLPAVTLQDATGPRLAYAMPIAMGRCARYGDANRLVRRWRSDEGAQLVEFALVLPLLLLIVLGIVEFGFMFQRYEVITNAAREGARMGVLPDTATPASSTRGSRPSSTRAACRRPAATPRCWSRPSRFRWAGDCRR